MLNFLDNINKEYGFSDAERHEEILDAFGIPNPQSDEWMFGNGCRIIFSSEYGLVFKTLSKNQYKSHLKFGKNAHLLQPLKHVEFQNSGFFLLAGVRLQSKELSHSYTERAIYSRLYDFGLDINDIRSENIGYIRDDNAMDQPILIDHGCINNDLAQCFNINSDMRSQNNFFRPVKTLLSEFWHDPRPDRGTNSMRFRNFCLKNVRLNDSSQDKMLFAAWKNPPTIFNKDSKPVLAQKIASKYQKRCQKLTLA